MSSERMEAVIFDLDGVLTKTALVHARAWQESFDRALLAVEGSAGDTRPFDPERDYLAHVDGKPRLDGVRDFLAARGIALPEGQPDDVPGRLTHHGIANAKNERFLALLRSGGVEVYDDALRQLRRFRARGFKTAIVSSSKNAVPVLDAIGALDLFDVKLDGKDAARLSLRGKPAPDTFLAAARLLGVPTEHVLLLEDSLAGVSAGAAAGLGLVVGVARHGSGDALFASGARRVVRRVDELDDIAGPRRGRAEERPAP